jgi:hypothetical protein
MKMPGIIITAISAVLVITAIIVGYRVASAGPPLKVTFIGYTNSPGKGAIVLFVVTNISSRQVQRYTWEVDYGVGRLGSLEGSPDLPPVTLQPGQGEYIEVPVYRSAKWRLAVLSTGTIKRAWNQFLTSTPYVATNQWESLTFDRSLSQWVVFPPPGSVQ